MENCYVENDFIVCFCGKCKPEDYELPSDFTELSKHMETNDRVDRWKKQWELLKCSATQVGGMIGFESSKDIAFIENLLTTHEREAVEAERKEWLSGNRCSLCGGSNLDSKGLSDVCGQCYEEQ